MMKEQFTISCESTVDLPYSYIASRGARVLFYTYTVDETEYTDDMGRDPEALPRFYALLEKGKCPHTSQINEMRYYDYFKSLLGEGDILHVAFGTGMTPSYHNAVRAAEALMEENPGRRITVIDSLCSCTGYGLLTEAALDLRDEGKSMDEIAAWLAENRLRVHPQFFSTDLTMFKRSGRVSGPVALVGNIFGIHPVMHLNEEGRIVAYDKVRGKKNAIAKTVETVLSEIDGGARAEGKIYISHSNCPELAEQTRIALAAALANQGERIAFAEIGTIIASHCGPGTVAVFYFGTPRAYNQK